MSKKQKKIKTMPQILTEILEAVKEASEDTNRNIKNRVEDLTEAVKKMDATQQETVKNLKEIQEQIERLLSPILRWLQVD